MAKGLPKRSENYSEWYNELVRMADLAEHSDVRGCMIIKPYGYAIWEKMQQVLDKKFKETGRLYIEDNYSLQKWALKISDYFHELVNIKK